MSEQKNKKEFDILPNISLGSKGKILKTNFNIFTDLYSFLKNVNQTNKTIFLQDSYYNEFYDGEVSLFFMLYKIYHHIQQYEEGQNKSNSDFIYLSDSDNLLNPNNNLYFNQPEYLLDKLGKTYSACFLNNSNQKKCHNFISLVQSQCFNKESLKIINILPRKKDCQEEPEVKKNRTFDGLFAFHVKNIDNFKQFDYTNKQTETKKNCYLFNNFFFSKKDYGTTKTDIDNIIYSLENFLKDRCNKLKSENEDDKLTIRDIYLIVNITDKSKKENYINLINQLVVNSGTAIRLKKIIVVSPLWFRKEAKEIAKINPGKISKFNVDSSFLNFSCGNEINGSNRNLIVFNNSSKKTTKLLKLVHSLVFNEMYSDGDGSKNYKIKHLYKNIRAEMILNDFGIKHCLGTVRHLVEELIGQMDCDCSIVKCCIDSIFMEPENDSNQSIDLLEGIVDLVKEKDYKTIYINHSKHYLRQVQATDFFNNIKENLGQEYQDKVKMFNKNYPLETVISEQTLLINLGQDASTNYFINKLDCAFIVDAIGYKCIYEIYDKIKNSNLVNYQLQSKQTSEELLENLGEVQKEVRDFFSMQEKEFKREVVLECKKTKTQITVKDDKRIFCSQSIDGQFIAYNIGDLVDCDEKSFFTFCLNLTSDNAAYIADQIKVVVSRKKDEIRTEIKKKIEEKLKYRKTINQQTQKDYLLALEKKVKAVVEGISNQQKKSYSNSKDRNNLQLILDQISPANLGRWLTKKALPQKEIIFYALLQLAGYSGDLKKAWWAIKEEISGNQQEGRKRNQEINKILDNHFNIDAFDDDIDSDTLSLILQAIKDKGLNEEYEIKSVKTINQESNYNE